MTDEEKKHIITDQKRPVSEVPASLHNRDALNDTKSGGCEIQNLRRENDGEHMQCCDSNWDTACVAGHFADNALNLSSSDSSIETFPAHCSSPKSKKTKQVCKASVYVKNKQKTPPVLPGLSGDSDDFDTSAELFKNTLMKENW